MISLFQQVAQWVARRLFSLQTAPWEETLFLSRWQTELPGVGDEYQVSTDMLRGLAICHTQNVQNDDDEEEEDDEEDNKNSIRERFWMYLPANQIMHSPTTTSSRGSARKSRSSRQEDDGDESTTAMERATRRAFDLLFEWKNRWLLDELEPYLQAVMDATGTSQANLLVLYTRVVTEEFQAGVSVKLYEKR